MVVELFRKNPGMFPSDFVGIAKLEQVCKQLKEIDVLKWFDKKYKLLINRDANYPLGLRDAKEPVEVLYYSGNVDCLNSKKISVMGTRKPSDQGLLRAEQITRKLVADKFTIVSGLAEGIDTIAHQTAINNGGQTIAVIGTPLDICFPAANKALQKIIGDSHLLISQVPFIRYRMQKFEVNSAFFPERNKTMSALSQATIIIEAAERSGTLVQATAALQQGRKLFILELFQ